MPNRENDLNQPIKGLNLDIHPVNLDSKNAYVFALNAKQESEDGNQVNITNDSSNTLALNFPDGYKVIGKKNIEDNRTIIFLYNPDTKSSEIGYIFHDISKCIDNIDDLITVPCDTCPQDLSLENRGEEIRYSTKPCQEYIKLVNDECLNFSLDYPIHKISYKITNQTIEIYWTDANNPPRWMDINKIPLLEDGRLDCNQIKISPDYKVPCIEVHTPLDTGSLKAGVYQFYVAYSNAKGEELSQYYSATNPVSIWENQPTNELGFTTSKSIPITINNLDTTFRYINIAVEETVMSVSTFKLIGYFDILSETFNYVYTGNDKTQRELTSADIFFIMPKYTKAETLEVQENILMLGGMTTEETVNYHSVASKIVIGWGSYIIPYNEFEGYTNGANAANYRSLLRDEVYALEFVPILKSGKIGPRTHIPGPISKPEYWEVIRNKDSESYKSNPCDEPKDTYRWQIYNTAIKEGEYPDYITAKDKNCYKGPYQYGQLGFYQSIRTYPNNVDLYGELAGQPIRHHKMPDVLTSPFYINNVGSEPDFQYSICPLGLRIDHQNIIKAIEESDLTQEQKDDIVGFQIVRATRADNNSIIAKGMLFNVGQYERDEQTYFFPNYNYNDLRADPFISKVKPEHHSGPNDGGCVEEVSLGTINENNNYYQRVAVIAKTELEKANITIPVDVFGQIYEIKTALVPIIEGGLIGSADIRAVGSTYDPDLSDNLTDSVIITPEQYLPGNVFIIEVIVSYTPTSDPSGILGLSFLIGFDESMNIIGIDSLSPTGEDPTNAILDINNGTETNRYTVRANTTNNEFTGVLRRCEIKSGDNRLEAFSDKEVSARRFTFHGPNTDFRRPPLNGFLKIEGVEYGKTKAMLTKITDEPKYTINSNLTVKVAIAMGISTILIMTQNGGMFGSPTMEINIGNFAPSFLQALEMMNKLVPFKQYGYQYLSVGDYSNFWGNTKEGEIVRDLEIVGYIAPGIQAINDINPVNNYLRESSVYLKTTDTLPYPHEYNTSIPIDNSRFNFNSYRQETGTILKDNERVIRNISSLYGSIKRPFDDQYGELYSYRTISTGSCFQLDRNSNKQFDILFGGDTFINRYALKRKLAFFLTNTVGMPNNSDVAYDELGNVGYPTYYLSTYPISSKLSDDTLAQAEVIYNKATKITIGDAIIGILTGGGANMAPFIKFAMLLGTDVISSLGIKNTNFDRFSNDGISESGTFYLFSYGIPYFFVESDINTELRQAENTTDRNFYPNVGTDIPEFWLQETNVSITKDNFYLYNRDFSKQNVENFYKELDRDFDPNKVNQDYFSTRVIYSEPTNLEERQNNWLVYKANNYYDFPLTYGKLIDLNALEQGKVLARFEDNASVYNAFVSINTDNKTAIVGTGSMFSTPPQEYSNADLGYLGTQHKAFTSTKYGYFWADAKRGEVFNLKNGSGLEEISRRGMRNWFKENLPFHITKTFKDYPIDNSFNSIGLSIAWDNRYDRLFITKKDLIVKNGNSLCYNPKDNTFRDAKDSDKIIEEFKNKGYTLNSSEDCILNFTKTITENISVLPRNTDIYAFFDTTSMLVADGISASNALKIWFDNIKLSNPDYEGNLYILPVGIERYVQYPYFVYSGSIAISGGSWTPISILPPNLNTSSWIPPKDLLVLAFVDETNSEYHGSTVTAGFSSPTQPTSIFVNNYVQFLETIPNFNYFKAVLYPIVQNITGLGGALVLQSMAAIEGKIMTPEEIVDTETDVNVSLLLTTNPYVGYIIPGTSDTLKPLKEYNWIGVYNKRSPASEVFNSETFGTELNDLLEFGNNYDITTTLEENVELPIISLNDENFFENASWTIAYSPQTESWISFYSFIPDYYIEQIGYFQTGQNYTGTLWNHNLTNKSYQVYYNEFYPFTISSITKTDLNSKTLQSVQYRNDVLRYTSSYDYKLMQNISFDEAIISDTLQTSGKLNLILTNKSNLSSGLISKTNTNSIDVSLVRADDIYKFNQFYDITRDQNSNVPLFKYDASNVNKEINPVAVNYKKNDMPFNRKRLKSDYFKIELSNTKQSRYKFIFKWLENKIIKSPR